MSATMPADEPAAEHRGGRAPKVDVDHVELTYRRHRKADLQVFRDISFTIDDGEFVAIIGPSGCGKTTMLNLIAGLLEPTGGELRCNGVRVTGPGRDRGVIFQSDPIFLWRTVRRNVAYGLEVQHLPKRERERRIDHYLDLVGLREFGDFYPRELSGGMKKRVAIATVLANQPDVLLLDEPFGSLDYPTRVGLQDELLSIWDREQTTSIFVTHDLEEAVYLADRILVIVAGELVEEVRVPFPRPRDPELRIGPELQAMKAQLWKYL
jgi:NitT/TauT family transport system ATP-binding protein